MKNLLGVFTLTIIVFAILLLCFAVIAGLLGSMTGLGGGFIIIPVLVLIFHINIHYAMGASLICVIATSSGSAAAYLREGYTNLRIGMFLETATVIGAYIGALLIAFVSKFFLTILFSIVLFLSAYLTILRQEENENYLISHPWAARLKLNGSYPLKNKLQNYQVQNLPFAWVIMLIAGALSGLLGIGAGVMKVLAMDQVMRLPYKVATTTSNFMIGITAAVSAGIYFQRGYIQPIITFPIMIGVIIGSFLGARILTKVNTYWLRIIFSIVICFVGLEMFYQAIVGNLS
ncbi:MAG: hypothetical protein ACD_46C00160G0002 [uncultured bacterium]|nr:MAG: hypothetical protein ACD_46C00160G0002 [uncultured bacterium]